MYFFKLIYFVIFILNIHKIRCQISDKRLCFDEKCSEPLSVGKTLLLYSSPDARILSFKPNQDVIIYSKEAGTNLDLWGAEINGKRGYVPKKYIRENKVLNKATILVDTQTEFALKVPLSSTDPLSPSKVENLQIIDGTTIYDPPLESIAPSATVSPTLATSMPHSKIQAEENSDESILPTVENKEITSQESPQVVNDVSSEKVDGGSNMGGVISSLSRWIKEDTKSEESDGFEDEEDEEDDDGEEDDDEDEDMEDIGETSEIIKANISKEAIDVNTSIYSQKDLLTSTENIDLNKVNPQVDVPKLSAYSLEVNPNTLEGIVKNDTKTESSKEIDSITKGLDATLDIKSNTQEKEKSTEENLQKGVNIEKPEIASHPEQETVEFVEKIEAMEADDIEKMASTPTPEISTSVPAINMKNVTLNSLGSTLKDLKTEKIPKHAQPLEVESGTINVENTTGTGQQEIKTNQTETELENNGLDNLVKTIPGETNMIKTENVMTQEAEKTDIENSRKSDEADKNINGMGSVTQQEQETKILNKIVQEETHTTQQNINNEDISLVGALFNNKMQSQKHEIQPTLEEETNNGQESVPNSETETAAENKTIAMHVDEDLKDTLESTDSIQDEQNQVQENIGVQELEINPKQSSQESGVDEQNQLDQNIVVQELEIDPKQSSQESGFFSSIYSFFVSDDDTVIEASDTVDQPQVGVDNEMIDSNSWTQGTQSELLESCDSSDKKYTFFNFNTDIFMYLVTTAVSCIIFLFVYMAMDRHKREGPLVAKINKLEKELLVILKENELLQECKSVEGNNPEQDYYVEDLKNQMLHLSEVKQSLESQLDELKLELDKKQALEEQIESLEKELETSTEVGMELNKLISEMLDPTNGSEKLKENVEQLQRQLLEQKETISSTQGMLGIKEIENEALQIDLMEYKRKTNSLETQLDQLLEKIAHLEKEKYEQQDVLQKDISLYQQKYADAIQKEEILDKEIQSLKVQILEVQKHAELKSREYDVLKRDVANIKSLKDGDTLDSLLDNSSTKAQLEQFKSENEKYSVQLQQERMANSDLERKYRALLEEIASLQSRYEDTDKEKTEATMKLEVLNNYFKKRESELQEEVLRYKSVFEAKEGAATSTTERIKLMLEEIENYKSQNETLKQEILSQEIDLKSQISLLEKKVHENWVTARQTERKLEDAKHEAAQLRNRLTLRERAFIEERTHNRLQSPIDQNGESALSPHPSLDSPASPPPLFGTNNRDHITKSPPLARMPPFLHPLPGAPFMPPPLPGMPHFMPPPPTVFPGDHRPPPLGRMSSPPPPLNSRYSPDTSPYSPYDRNSPSPYDSEYGTTPPVRGYSPFNGRDDRREYNRQPHSRNRNLKGSTLSSGSDQSNDSMDKNNRKHSKMV